MSRGRPQQPLSSLSVGDARGQTETVAAVLLIGITVIGTVAIVTFGSTALDSTEQQVRNSNAENAMTQLDANAAEVALGGSETKRARLPSQGPGRDVTVTRDGWIKAEIINSSDGSVEKTIVDQTMGKLVYDNQGTEVAYQGGGVWRHADNYTQMVSPPEFHYRGETLVLPIVNVHGSQSQSETVLLRKNGTTTRKFPNENIGNTNPITDGEITITVKSEYYQGWGEYFNQRTDGTPDYDHENETVAIKLVVERNEQTLTAGVTSGGGTTLTLENNAEADSYNSSNGNYSSTAASNTNIVAAGDVVVSHNAQVHGNLEVEQDVTVDNNADITGTLSYGGTKTISAKASIGDGPYSNASVTSPESVGWLIEQKGAEYEGSNDNGATGNITSSDELDSSCSTSCEIGPGDYYLDDIDLDGTLVLNNTGGPIDIYVNGSISVNSGTIDVTNGSSGHPVKIYNDGDFYMDNNAVVTVPDENATAFWVYMKPATSATLENNVKYVGVIYGPNSDTQSGVDVEFVNNADYYGAVVGDVDSINQNVEFHYDEALASKRPIDSDEKQFIPLVTYIHVTVNDIDIEN